LNKDETIVADTIKELGLPIDRWKILKMDVFKNDTFDNSDIQVTDKEYDEFVKRNMQVFSLDYEKSSGEETKNHNVLVNGRNLTIVPEKSVTGSYIIVDANGYLSDDSQNDNYTHIIDCVTEDFIEGFKKLPFNKKLYQSRYSD
jgi:hypothetical protein